MCINTDIQIENHENIILYMKRVQCYGQHLKESGGHVGAYFFFFFFLKLTGPHSNVEALIIISNFKKNVRKQMLKILDTQKF
jgi:hypothetical protein